MSVRSAQRTKTPDKFVVIQAAERLVDYSYMITENKNTFPDGYPPKPSDPSKLSKWAIACRKRDVSRAMLSQMREYSSIMAAKLKIANSIIARTANNFKARIRLESEALEYAYMIKQLISVVAESYHLSKRRLEFWNSLDDFLISRLKPWIRSERKRCMETFESGKINNDLNQAAFDSIMEDII